MKTGYVQTVMGQMDVQSLGICQCHEHLLIGMGESFRVNPALFMEDIQKSTRDVLEFRQAGGGALVDAQPPGCGRMIEGLLAISEKTGVPIVASTGFHKRIFYRKGHALSQLSEEALGEFFYRELTVGAGNTGIRAGIIKTALDENGLDEQAVRQFGAAARAQRKNGCALMIHIERGADPLLLYDFLSERGVYAEKMIFCHLDRACSDTAVHERLLRSGCYLEYDTIARENYHGDKKEASLIMGIVEKGLGSRLLLSLDTTAKRLKSYTPEGPGLSYLLSNFCRLLLQEGIGEQTLKEILIANPARVLARQETPPGNSTGGAGKEPGSST